MRGIRNRLSESSSRFASSSGPRIVNPVTFSLGRARLATRPAATGSADDAFTMGMVSVACIVASAPGVPVVTMTSGLRRTSSVAKLGSRSSCPSAHRYSIAMFRRQHGLGRGASVEMPQYNGAPKKSTKRRGNRPEIFFRPAARAPRAAMPSPRRRAA
jgi:hypothetical protein